MIDWETLAARFEARVDRSGECHVWTGRLSPKGYGQIDVGHDDRRAHRVAWRLATGEWPPTDLLVCHACDNPPCVRFDHLWLGTHADNAADKVAKGRQPRGETSWAVLTEAKVREIRALAGTATHVELACMFGVSKPTIGRLLRGETWTHVV